MDSSGKRPFNKATNSRPCVIHANGWEKMPLIQMVRDTGEITPAVAAEMFNVKAKFDKTKVLLF